MVEIANDCYLSAGEVNTVQCIFELPDEYKGLTVMAKFTYSETGKDEYTGLTVTEDKTVSMQVADGVCELPHEAMVNAGTIKIGITAYELDGDTVDIRYSPTPVKKVVYEGSTTANGENSGAATPTLFEQQVAEMQGYLNSAQTAANNAQTYKNTATSAADAARQAKSDAEKFRDEAENTAEETALEVVDTRAPAIIKTSSGEVVAVNDSANAGFQGLKVFGKTTQDGTPTPEAPIELVSIGADGSVEMLISGVNLIDKNAEIKNVFVNQNAGVGSTLNPQTSTASTTYVRAVRVYAGQSYIISYERPSDLSSTNGRYGVIVDDNNVVLQSGIQTFSPAVTTIEVVANCTGWITFSVDSTCTNVMVSAKECEYSEPSESQIFTLSTPNGLPGIPVASGGNYTDKSGQQWICDEIDFARGKYIQRVWHGRPTKPIAFTSSAPGGRFTVFENGLLGAVFGNGATPSMSTIAKWSAYAAGDEGSFALASNGIYYKDSTKTLEEVNAIFADLGTEIEFVGVLAEPIETDLLSEQIAAHKALHTNYPSTTVINDEGTWMEVKYVADTETFIKQNYVPKSVYSDLEARVLALENQAVSNV